MVAVEFWSWKRMAALVAVGVVVGVGFADPTEAGTRPADPEPAVSNALPTFQTSGAVDLSLEGAGR